MDFNQIRHQLGLESWNDMQQAAHRLIPQNKDLIILAPTGTGKTLAFLPPMVAKLAPQAQGVQVLILTPSRELALQIENVWRGMATGWKVSSFYGGRDLSSDKGKLLQPPALVIGTPGRIADHLSRATFDTEQIHTVILDEFDKLLALGFEEELSYIIRQLKNVKQRILVSATRQDELPSFTGISDPVILDYTATQKAEENRPSKVSLHTIFSPEKDKIATLVQLLSDINTEMTLIFCNHREAVERTASLLQKAGIYCAAFHGGMDQEMRELTLTRFQNRSVLFLVTTDLAGRGLDIPEVRHVVHYHLPHTQQDYIHRNGRTARMFAEGTVWFIMHESETLPEYVTPQPKVVALPKNPSLPSPPEWVTVRINGGRKQKISKGDVAGFFIKVGGLAKDDIGSIDIKDQCAYAAVKQYKVRSLLDKAMNQKLKGKTFKLTSIK